MMNEQFMRSEIEYRRQQRLAAAAEHRRARAAVTHSGVRTAFALLFATRRGAHRAAPRGAARAA